MTALNPILRSHSPHRSKGPKMQIGLLHYLKEVFPYLDWDLYPGLHLLPVLCSFHAVAGLSSPYSKQISEEPLILYLPMSAQSMLTVHASP